MSEKSELLIKVCKNCHHTYQIGLLSHYSQYCSPGCKRDFDREHKKGLASVKRRVKRASEHYAIHGGIGWVYELLEED
jgi:hypothetical protein